MEFFLIYLFVMVEKIAAMFAIGWAIFWVPALALIAVIVISVIYGIDYDFDDAWNHEISKFIKKIAKIFMPIGFVLGTIGHLMPNQEQLAIIVGSGVTYHVLTSEPAQRIGGKALQLLEEKIEKTLENTPIEKEKESGKAETEKSSGKEHAQST